MKVVSSARLRKDLQEKLTSSYKEIEFLFCNRMPVAEQHLSEADILITFGEDLNEERIAKAKQLKWIMVISAGMDQMPFEAIGQRGIVITNARGIHKTPMAEYTISMMLQTARQTKRLLRNQEDKVWDRRITMSEITGKTIGILGTGAIGMEIARLSKVFHMKTMGFNRSGRQSEYMDQIVDKHSLAALFKESDFIVNVLPRTKETTGLINRSLFLTMKKEAVFINIGRGTTVVEKDLIDAISSQDFAHAVLDVFDQEPLPQESPLWHMENVTITPHLSGISPLYQDRAIELFEQNLTRYLSGQTELINMIPWKRGY